MINAGSLLFALGVTCGALFGLPAVIALPIAAGVVQVLARQRVFLLVGVVLLGALLGHIRVTSQQPESIDSRVLTATRIEGVVDSVPQLGPSGARATIEVTRASGDTGEWEDASGRILVFFRDTVESGLTQGDIVQIRTSVQDASGFDPDFRRFVRSEGAAGVAWAFATVIQERGDEPLNVIVRLRGAITSRIQDAMPGDAGALIAGFVTGDDSNLSDAARLAFERTNTSHITAVSGGNVAILLAMWGLIVPPGRFRRHLAMQLVLVLLIWGYVGLVGFGPASLRAALFATLLIPAARFGRKADPMTSLMLASAILLLVDPGLADSVGFWLSLAASTALVTVIPVGAQDHALSIPRILAGVLAAQLATLPITFWVFGQWSPAGVVANLVIAPLVTLMMPIAFAMAALLLVSSLFGIALGWLPAMGAAVILACVKSLSLEFPSLQSGPISDIGVMLIAILCASPIAVMSVDFRRWLLRVEFANWNAPGWVPASLVGALTGIAAGLLLVTLL